MVMAVMVVKMVKMVKVVRMVKMVKMVMVMKVVMVVPCSCWQMASGSDMESGVEEGGRRGRWEGM